MTVKLKIMFEATVLIKAYIPGTKTLRMLTQLHHKKRFCCFFSVLIVIYVYLNKTVSDMVKLYTGSKNL